ncbi:MAG: antitermination protein NusG, partial [Saprospiraceae bacterium]|nr:antitermination protein NusG [Saprospiraceae bacterium]
MTSIEKTNHWQVLRVKPRHDIKVAAFLLRSGIEHYLPMIKTKRVWSDRLKWVDLPLMSPYLFVRIPDKERNKVFISQSILSYVFYNGEIATVRDSEINQIRTLCEKNSSIGFASQWNLNDRCIIDYGVMKGVE